jgi:quinohemoprotein ethanol dehydrogenase
MAGAREDGWWPSGLLGRVSTRVLIGLVVVGTSACREPPTPDHSSFVRIHVDDAALLAGDAAGWLSYGRDQSGTHFSPLAQIDRGNATRLEPIWSWKITDEATRLEAVPLVTGGVIFATGVWSIVYALDARTGTLRWSWDPEIARDPASGGPQLCCGPVNRGVALYGDKVYAGLLDGRLVALDANSGDLVWVRETADVTRGYSITGAPRVAGGRIIIGNAGAEFGVRGYVSAFDPETGEMLWRFFTVPGDPSLGFESAAMEAAAETWFGRWWEGGGGGTAWDAIAYDAEHDLVLVGVGNGAPWSRAERSEGRGDNLYLAAIVALSGVDGSLVWHYQTTPGEEWDYTATQNMILADLQIDARRRSVLMQASKNGFFYVLDRHDGDLISARAFADVSWAFGVDEDTGRPIESGTARYDDRGRWVAPGPRGAHSWPPMSWNPITGLVYIPGENSAAYYTLDPTNESRRDESPRASLGPPGFLLAWDPVEGKERWRVPFGTGGAGGTLTTAGGLVFLVTGDGWFEGRDATSGDLIWASHVGPGSGTPVTYLLDGRQLVSVLSGGRVWTFAVPGSE